MSMHSWTSHVCCGSSISGKQNDDFLWEVAYPFKMTSLFFTLWLFSVSSVWRSFENLPAPPDFPQEMESKLLFLQRKHLFSQWFVDISSKKHRFSKTTTPEARALCCRSLCLFPRCERGWEPGDWELPADWYQQWCFQLGYHIKKILAHKYHKYDDWNLWQFDWM